jgi:uncharacterized membrane-anchored protein YhcB (DUF1043 family)
MKNGLIGGIILGSIVLFEMIMVKHQKRVELETQNFQAELINQETRKTLASRRADLFYPDGSPRVGKVRPLMV